MNIAVRLRNYLFINEDIKQLELEYEDLKDEIQGKAIVYNDMPTAHTVQSQVENYVMRKQTIKNKIKKLEREKVRIELSLKALDKEELFIIQNRYMKLEPFSTVDILASLSISEPTYYRKRKKAINKIKDRLQV